MQKFMEDLMKNASNPQAVFQQLVEANKSLTETWTKQIAPSMLDVTGAPKVFSNINEAPKKALENLKKYSELNEKFAKDVQEAGKASPFDMNGLLKATVDYQQSLLETNTAIVKDFFNEVTASVKTANTKTK